MDLIVRGVLSKFIGVVFIFLFLNIGNRLLTLFFGDIFVSLNFFALGVDYVFEK